MLNFTSTEEMVTYVLEKYPITRQSDSHLLLGVYALIDKEVVKMPFKDVMKKITSDKRFPSFETVSRCRRKVQAKREELKNKDVANYRENELQKAFKKYATS